MINSIPNLSLGKKTKEALEYYKSIGITVLGEAYYFGKDGMGEMPGFDENDIAFVALAVDGMQSTVFMMAGEKDKHTGNLTLIYDNNPEDTKKMEAFYKELAKESKVIAPLSVSVLKNYNEEFYYAFLIDKFGVLWNLNQKRK